MSETGTRVRVVVHPGARKGDNFLKAIAKIKRFPSSSYDPALKVWEMDAQWATPLLRDRWIVEAEAQNGGSDA